MTMISAITIAFISIKTCPRNTQSKVAVRLGMSDVYQHGAELRALKRSAHALLCGSGPSANLIERNEARFFEETTDVWASNQFFVHAHLTPRFHHTEFKRSSLDFWHAHLQDQAIRFRETTFLLDDSNLDALSFLRSRSARIFVYAARNVEWKARDGCTEADGYYAPLHCGRIVKSCSASMSLILHLLVLMRYTSLYVVGIDLVSPDHFWTNNSAYPRAIANFYPQVNFNKGVVPTVITRASGVHPTQLRGFSAYLVGFLAFNNLTCVNLSPLSRSALRLPYVHIRHLVQSCLRRGHTVTDTVLSSNAPKRRSSNSSIAMATPQYTFSCPSARGVVRLKSTACPCCLPDPTGTGADTKRGVVYTISTGERGAIDIRGRRGDPLNEIESETYRRIMLEQFDYIWFCDSPMCQLLCGQHRFGPSGMSLWRLVHIDESAVPFLQGLHDQLGDAHLLSRSVKIMPHLCPVLNAYRSWVYVDGNVMISRPVSDLFRGGHDVLAWTYSSPKERAWLRNYFGARLNSSGRTHVMHQYDVQLKRYMHAYGEMPFSTVVYGKIVIRLNNNRTQAFNRCWWNEFTRGVPRDQVGLYYCLLDAQRSSHLTYSLVNTRLNKKDPPFTDPLFLRFFIHLAHRLRARAMMSKLKSTLYP